MATQPTEGIEPDDVTIDEPEGEQVETTEQHEESADEDDGYVIEIEGDDAGEQEPENSTVRRMRDELKEEKRRRVELERQLAPKPVDLGKKPDLWEDCEGDPDKFEAALSEWHERKNAADKQTAEQARAQEAANEKVRQRDTNYLARAQALQARAKIAPEAYRESEAAVQRDIMSGNNGEHIKALTLGYLDDPAVVIHVLGTKPALRDRIAAIDDPVKQFLAIYDLSKEIKMTPKKKAAPAPEERVSGTAKITASGGNYEKDLAKLEKEAERTGDRTKIIALKKAQKQKGAAK